MLIAAIAHSSHSSYSQHMKTVISLNWEQRQDSTSLMSCEIFDQQSEEISAYCQGLSTVLCCRCYLQLIKCSRPIAC